MSLTGSINILGPGTALGQYLIVRQLGEGGMGAVYEAKHTGLDKRVVLKALHPSLADSQEATERFLREGRAAARLRHPHVVDVTDVAVDKGTPYLVMEFLQGEDLSKLIERSAPLPFEQIVEIMLPVCAAIATAHEEGVVHRDLKPENIFLSKPRTGPLVPKVLDFGISKIVESGGSDLTSASSVMGSPFYMSPEHARGAIHVTTRSDQYALGVIVYEMLTKRRPFEKENLFAQLNEIVHGTLIPPRKYRTDIPTALEHAVLRAMHRDPRKRFDSLMGFGRALLPFGSERVRAVWEPTFGTETIRTDFEPPEDDADIGNAHTEAAPAAAELAELQDTIPETGGPPASSLGPSTLGTSVTRVMQAPLPAAKSLPAPAPLPAAKPSTSRWRMVLGLGVLLGASMTVWWSKGRGAETDRRIAIATPRAYRANVTAIPSTSTLSVDDVPQGVGSMSAEFAADGVTHWLRGSAPGYETISIPFRDAPPPARLELRPLAVAPAAGPPAVTAPPVVVPPVAPAIAEPPTPSAREGSSTPTRRPSGPAHRPAGPRLRNGSQIIY